MKNFTNYYLYNNFPSRIFCEEGLIRAEVYVKKQGFIKEDPFEIMRSGDLISRQEFDKMILSKIGA